MPKKYDKLIRDDIPEIIRENGEEAICEEVEGAEYKAYLEEKLREETEEYFEDQDVDELADVLEVVYALSRVEGVTKDKLEETRKQKRKDRGGFEEGIVLKQVQ
jgi:predicted house-cleaning noncanonical NTP pyrophosphatase (MazG superfamily)